MRFKILAEEGVRTLLVLKKNRSRVVSKKNPVHVSVAEKRGRDRSPFAIGSIRSKEY
jgi:hypothetical protein